MAWVRSPRDAADLAGELRAAARRFNPIMPAPDVERMTDRIRLARTEPRFQATLFVSFACIAVLLAAIGLYGTLAHERTPRRHLGPSANRASRRGSSPRDIDWNARADSDSASGPARRRPHPPTPPPPFPLPDSVPV